MALAAVLAAAAVHAQPSRLDKLEAAGASSALDRFEFGRSKVKPRPPASPPRTVVRPPPPRDDPDPEPGHERPRKVARKPARVERPEPRAIESRPAAVKPVEARPDPWLSHAGAGGWGPLVLE